MLLSLLSKRTLEVDSRDSYGFALRPQFAQRYREYSLIYKEEEDERSDKWRSFLEQVAKSSQPSSSEYKHIDRLKSEGNEIIEETIVDRVSKGDSSDRNSFEGTEVEEDTSLGRVGEGDASSGSKSVSGSSTGNNIGKEQHRLEERKKRKVQQWAEIMPSLTGIDKIMCPRVKNGKNVKGEKINGNNDRLPSIEESEPVEGVSKEDMQEHVCTNGTPEDSALQDQESPELFSPWKELETLVQGGVPKDLRGEVWQAFVGVRTRRKENYYEDLLAQETHSSESKEQDASSVAFGKWRKQIEKDIPRTFPGHPALDEHGRDSLRRLLLAYARHNPSVGYCQAMNFFAGLLLLLMPEENAFWTFVGIIDDYFEGYYTEEMIESQVAWISGPWFLSIFMNMIPWESVLRVWDVLLFEGNRVMLFRTALALMELYGPALVTTKDAGDAITLLQSLAGSTFDSSQLVFTACMGYLAVTEARLQELREKHRPSVLDVLEERARKGRVWKDSKGLASKLYSFKHDQAPLVEERKTTEGGDMVADEDKSQLESRSSNIDELLNSLNVDSELDALPDVQDQVVWLKVELCRLLEEKRSAVLRAEELETALVEMVKEDNRLQLSARVEELEQEVAELKEALAENKEQEAAMLQVLMRLEQDQKVTEEARRRAEQDLAAQKYEVHVLQEKYDNAVASIAEMQKRVVMAESTLEATLQYESGQSKALSSPRAAPAKKTGLLNFGLGWRDRNKGKQESGEILSNNSTPREESNNKEQDR
ncbi:PREDICTED: ecotropic viral integration site 5 protein homolog isoform X2 [Lupinus angustifolius]|uniref:ecotropic viral integration site 5 protein homolog isoform X2 n=1 Tax=Lupinus angustifolius TaxID=3871 RepID=UPI00092E9FC8|nr:PREDICTED: ecotropic viral integration site 5 protein homolog isoform X2 [Lupinus angustifolius]